MVWWKLVAEFGPFVGALATVALAALALGQLKAVRKQVELSEKQSKSARRSADAAQEAVRQTTRARIAGTAPRVIALWEPTEWPPFINPFLSGMPGGGKPSLIASLDQSHVADPEHDFVFPEEEGQLLWFRTYGVVKNEGRSSARVRLPGTARFISGKSRLVKAGGATASVPPLVDPHFGGEHLLEPGQFGVVEWGAGHPLGSWADAWTHHTPPNPHGTCFAEITVSAFDSATVDKIYIELRALPIQPVPSRDGHWRLVDELPAQVTTYATERLYEFEGTGLQPAPWHERYKEWDELHR